MGLPYFLWPYPKRYDFKLGPKYQRALVEKRQRWFRHALENDECTDISIRFADGERRAHKVVLEQFGGKDRVGGPAGSNEVDMTSINKSLGDALLRYVYGSEKHFDDGLTPSNVRDAFRACGELKTGGGFGFLASLAKQRVADRMVMFIRGMQHDNVLTISTTQSNLFDPK